MGKKKKRWRLGFFLVAEEEEEERSAAELAPALVWPGDGSGGGAGDLGLARGEGKREGELCSRFCTEVAGVSANSK